MDGDYVYGYTAKQTSPTNQIQEELYCYLCHPPTRPHYSTGEGGIVRKYTRGQAPAESAIG